MPEAVAAIETGTQREAPNEAFGVLVGRTFEDAAGSYTLVTAAVYAKQGRTGAAHVQLSTAEMALLRKQAERLHPTEDLVGWTHSHAMYSQYSATDRAEQATWPGENQVGLLSFMAQGPWARAYRGPESTPLLEVAAEDLGASIEARGDDPCGRAAGLPAGGKLEPPRLALVWQNALAFTAVNCLLGVFLLLLLHADRSIGPMTGRLAALEANTAPARPFSLVWRCDDERGSAPLWVTCTAPAGEGITGGLGISRTGSRGPAARPLTSMSPQVSTSWASRFLHRLEAWTRGRGWFPWSGASRTAFGMPIGASGASAKS